MSNAIFSALPAVALHGRVIPAELLDDLAPGDRLDNSEKKDIYSLRECVMEEIEVSSWLTLDAVKRAADVIETVGNLQTGHSMSVFCEIAEDCLELCYSDSAASYLRRFEDRDEFEVALEQRKEDVGDAPYEEDEEAEDDEEEDADETEDGFQIEGEFDDP
jgi:hypothetical protein